MTDATVENAQSVDASLSFSKGTGELFRQYDYEVTRLQGMFASNPSATVE